MEARGIINKRIRQLITFALVALFVLIINKPVTLFATGEYDGVWVGSVSIDVPGVLSFTDATGTMVYQENENTLYFFDSLFGAVQLVKSGGNWVLPSPIWTTFLGYQAYVTETSITFHSSSYLTGSITAEVVGVTGTGSLSLTKQSCQSLTKDSTVSGISGGTESVRCYEIGLPSGANNLNVQTWGGSGDCDLLLIYHRPSFDFYSSENMANKEEINLTSPNSGNWYIILLGVGSYSGLNLKVSYVVISAPSAKFDADVLTGPASLSVNFADYSTGSINSWSWNFGDGSGSTEQNPSHTYVKPGTYTVSLTVAGPGGSDTETKTGYITVEPSRAMPWIPLLLVDD